MGVAGTGDTVSVLISVKDETRYRRLPIVHAITKINLDLARVMAV